jgi:outer membrane lipoprotein-sorting protein
MNRRTLLAVPAAWLLARAAAAAQPITLTAQDHADLTRIEAYLDTLRTLKAHFLQVSSNGSNAEGTAWLERPGHMRFDYKPPSPFLLVANHGSVVFQDRQLGQVTNYPIGATPLGILLADHVTLSGGVTVTGIARQPGQIQVTMVRTATPGDGSLSLVFEDKPLALRQWVVLDAQRQETSVSLFNIELGGKFDPSLFDLPASAPGNQR